MASSNVLKFAMDSLMKQRIDELLAERDLLLAVANEAVKHICKSAALRSALDAYHASKEGENE